MPSISIIVPVYNGEKTLLRCFKSISEQSFSDFECIVVDDGSTDNSSVLCDEYAMHDKRFLVIHKKNGGVSSARNVGLRMAKGEYIGFVDCDDFISKNMYETLWNLHFTTENNIYDLVVCNYNLVNGDSVKYTKYNFQLGCITKQKLKKLHLSAKGLDGFLFLKIFRNNIIVQNNIKFDENVKYLEDTLFSYTFLQYCQAGYITNEPLYNYCVTQGSATQQNRIPDGTLYVFDKLLAMETDRKLQTLIERKKARFIVSLLVKKRCRQPFFLPSEFPKGVKLLRSYLMFMFDFNLGFMKKMYYTLLIMFPKLNAFFYRLRK